MLKFSNVSKQFGNIQALDDVSFEIDPGEFVFITGPSGAGKTTLLRLLIREFLPTSGEIVFDEFEVHNLKNKHIPSLRQNIGSVFQDFRLLPERTVKENTEVALAVKKVARDEWDDRVNHVLKLVGLAARANLFPSQLSGGEEQRAALARALIINPKLIFADEPTGNLDWKTAGEIAELLAKINEEGKTVIVTTHNRDIVKNLGKRVIEIDKGKVSGDTGKKDKKSSKKEDKKQ